MRRKVIAGTSIGLGAAALVLVAHWLLARPGGAGFLQAVEMRTYDWRLVTTAQPSTARQDIVLIEIDEYSLRNLSLLPAAGRGRA